MKKYFLTFIICLFCTNVFSQNFVPVRWDNYAFTMGYSRFNESHGNNEYNFKNNQLNIGLTIYGIYWETTLGFSEYSYEDNYDLSTWGMNFGYMFPIYQDFQTNYGLYLTPMCGFQNIGYFDNQYSCWDDDYVCMKTYFNYGAAIGMNFDHFYIQGEFTKMECGFSLGYKF